MTALRGGDIRVVAGSFLGVATGVSSLYFYSLAVFLKPVAATFGWSRGEASLAPLIGTLCAAAGAPLAGWLVDRIGPLRTAIVAMVVLAAVLAALGVLTRSYGSFLALTAVLALFTVGSTGLAYSRLIVARFDRHRGLALGLTMMGTGVGATLVPGLLVPFVAAHGWRAGYLVLAGVVVAALLPIVGLLRGSDEGVRGRPARVPFSAVVANPAFALLAGLFLLAAIGVFGTVVHFVAMLSDAGMSPAQAGRIAAVSGLAVLASRVVTGLALDRFPAGRVTAAILLVSAIGMALLAWGGMALAVPGALAIGAALGAEVDLLGYLTARHFAPAVYGAAYGAIYACFLVGGAIGPALTGYLFDLNSGYSVPLAVSAIFLVVAAVVALQIDKRRDLADKIGRSSSAP